MTEDEVNGLLQRSKELLQEFNVEGHPMVSRSHMDTFMRPELM